MCGIGAFHVVGGEVNPGRCARVLLRLLEQRGRDASGVAWHQQDSSGAIETMVWKGNIKGSQLAEHIKPEQIGSTGIVHTRWATQGDPGDNLNNHPIDVAGIVGVHNGHVSNDVELFKHLDVETYKRQGKVDSEAAFAWMAHGDEQKSIVERMSMIRGNAALMWLESGDKRQRLHAARLTSSPLVLGQMEGGSVILASTKAILDESAKRLNIKFVFEYEFSEGEYAIIENGRISDMLEVPMPKKESRSYGYSSVSTSAYSAGSLFEKGGK